ncbi:unnamed protein product [Sphagnum jensenii]|uniref:NADP-dependent oxidoreductase domain-containing protein n=1 Tax=Sphagnum jensenii TaxID=128206 RepID=A0ABP1AN29_9BRYO
MKEMAEVGELATFKLPTGHHIPALGLGTWKSEPNKCREAVYAAVVEAGYRHIDCADKYGNQEEVGEALKAAMETGIARQDLFVTSKLWCADLDPMKVKQALEKTLHELQLEYLDLYLIHWPVHTTVDASRPPSKDQVLPLDLNSVWREMEKLVEEKLVRDIGVCNFTVPKLEVLLKTTTIKPAVNQVEMHPGWRNDKILDFCKRHHIHVTAYSPLGSQATDELHDPTVTQIAEKIRKTPGQVLIRWAIQRGVSAIPKSSSPHRIKENMQVFDWKLAAENFETLSSFQNQKRVQDGYILFVNPEEGPLRSLEEFWDGEI